jgi:type IV pilus assembly protein PilY1
MLMMKSASGHAFVDLDDRYRIGFITIRPGNNTGSTVSGSNQVSTSRFQPVRVFDNAQKLAFFEKLYAQGTSGNTPLREALSRVGRYFARQTGGINSGMSDDPVEYSCQQNFALLTTDGYWNDAAGVKVNSSAMDNQDNTNAGYAQRADGAYDGSVSGSSGTLADVALYYYQTDLRTAALSNCTSGASGLDICQNNVPTSPADANDTQHMTTFTLGLVDGLMRYQTDYDTATSSDVAKIKSSATGCPWSPTAICNWPVPTNDQQSAIDDLWHAAVNGRGRYYNARDPETLSFGLKNALSNVVSQVAAAAAAATSTPNINQFDNFVFSSTYRTVTWDGEVIARNIDPASGNVLPTVVWSAQTQLDAVAPAARKLYVRNGASFANFDFATLPGAVQGFFTNKCSLLSQCTDLSAAQQTTVNDGTTLVNYLRGDKTNEPDLFRQRDHVLGDTVNAVPVYVSKPQFQFGDAVTPTYGDFKAAQASRPATLYVGANDGMMHAFDGATGQEIWAYVPTMVMANMHLLADKNYSIKHAYFVDGAATVMDAYFGGAWHTVLVAGLNKGGQGYYALDVTNPAAPTPLWEFCTDSTICTSSDPNIGFSFGNPVITKRPDGKWVALLTSGYNNADGQGWLYVLDLQTGAVLDRVSTLAGSPGTPSGLSKLTALANNFAVDNTVIAVYAGDLLGNVWKFDMTPTPPAPPTVQRLAQATAPGGATQPITTRPEITRINTNLVLYVTTGEYLGVSDLATTQTQTVYAFKDTDTDLGALRANSGMLTNTPVVNPDGSVTIPSGFSVNWTSQVGWYVDLPRAGERVNIDPQLIQGTLLVVSNQPDTNACSTGGQSFFYQFDYANPTAVSSSVNGTTLGIKIGSAVAVGLTVIKLPSGAVKALIPTADTKITTFGVNIGSGSVSTRRIGWRQLF